MSKNVETAVAWGFCFALWIKCISMLAVHLLIDHPDQFLGSACHVTVTCHLLTALPLASDAKLLYLPVSERSAIVLAAALHLLLPVLSSSLEENTLMIN